MNFGIVAIMGGWSGFGMETVGIHPNDFGVLNGHPNKIPTNEMSGDVVQNCQLRLRPYSRPLTLEPPSDFRDGF